MKAPLGPSGAQGRLSRRSVLSAGAALAGAAGLYALRGKLIARLSRWTQDKAFTATPPLVAHDPARERRTIHVAQGGAPAANVDAVLGKLGGLDTIVGKDDVVLVKVSAQWWNQGMTNVAAVRRLVEHVLEVPGFSGEVIVFDNVHFRLADGSGLARAWTHPSVRNVDVEGWRALGDLIPFFHGSRRAPVSFVGLIDAGLSALSRDPWCDPGHGHGVYGGDGRGPLAPGECRDGYCWDFGNVFSMRRSLVEWAKTPLTWPVLISPATGLLVDLRDGVFRVENGRRVPAQRRLTWINMTTANEHGSTGYTGAVKSAMGVVDMSAGALGTDPRARGYRSVHYFGAPEANWRLAGPLAHFASAVRRPDLYLTVAEWVGARPPDGELEDDLRLSERSAFRARTVVAGVDPVAIDTWCVRHLLMPIGGAGKADYDLDDENAKVVKFLRYYRQALGWGTMDESLIDVV